MLMTRTTCCVEALGRARPLVAVDASIVAIAERLGTTEIATLDLRHFTVVRSRSVQAFTLLPLR